MTRPTCRRLLPPAVGLALLLQTALLAGASTTTVAAAPTAPGLTAVVSYATALPVVDGVTVRQDLGAVRSAVVTADAAALSALAAAPGVRAVVPDRPLKVTGDGDSSSSPVFAGARLGDTDAGRPGAGAGVRVAVVDTGVSDTAALDRASGRLVDAFDSGAGSPTEVTGVTGVTGPLVDGYGHGTFMASIVAGGAVPVSDGRPIGVAPAATVLVVRVADATGSTSLSRVLAGLDWIAAHPDEVDVVSLSLGGERPGDAYGPDPLTDAVQAVQDAGVTVVVASGNEPATVSDPGFLPSALTVGSASTRTGEVAAHSGYDVVDRAAGIRKPDVVASGVSVLGVLPADSVIAREHPQARVAPGVWKGSGTSQATAVASGAAALLLAEHPDATPADVKASFTAAARPLGTWHAGAGLIRVPSTLVDAPEPAPSGVAGTGTPGSPTPSANSWSASSWSASSWSASSWSASSWSASSWSASSWSASSWSASSWSASSWSASTWSSSGWGDG